ncbi:hypothetical protein [Aeromonas hydrophila]|uniref:hypothetical protein n=1 Tax=Aeromonas hydrophila TaxID=644 RepID=UPI00191D1817|nr:hypothetical protein [Aeromonas hydrophila]MBL0559258.1 hypothetical protein [Aeromonas hydrophila]
MTGNIKKDIEDSNEVERLYRRNSLFVSSLIAIYALAGGRIDGEVSAVVIKIHFSQPYVLEFSMVLVSVYLWWRHLLVSKSIRSELEKEAISKTRCNGYVGRWVERMQKKAKDAQVKKFPELAIAAAAQPIYTMLLSDVGFSKITLSHTDVDFSGQRMTRNMQVDLFSNPIAFAVVNAKYRYSWFSQSIFNTHFGDGVLPSIMIALSMMAYFFK